MEQLSRRAAVIGLATLCSARRATAQEVCSAGGMTADEALAAWLDAHRVGEMNRNSLLVGIKRVSRVVFRGKNKDGEEVEAAGVLGALSVNGTVLGDVLENEALRIRAGDYKGVMRYVSQKNFVQGPFGTMGERGDFLLEISGASGRTNLLVHTGTKPWHSKGCILAGAAKRTVVNGKTVVTIDDDSTLRKLRLAFYGSDLPNACPNKTIRVSVVDIA
jgi:hypothetical protein